MEYRQGSRWSVVTGQWGSRRTRKERDPNLPDFTQLTLSKSEYKALPIERGHWAPNPSCLVMPDQQCPAWRHSMPDTAADLEPYREYPALDLHLNLFASGLLDKPNFKSNCLHANCWVHSYPMKTSAGKCHLLSGIA